MPRVQPEGLRHAGLFTVVQPSTLRIQVNVPQSYAADLNAGQKAEVLIPERPGKKYEGTVARTAKALQSASRTLVTEVQIDNKDSELLPGMYAQVKFDIPRREPIAVIPADALIINAKGTRVAGGGRSEPGSFPGRAGGQGSRGRSRDLVRFAGRREPGFECSRRSGRGGGNSQN